MMDLASIWAQLEQDQQWRVDEIRFFDNHALRLEAEADQEKFRRANVLLLYSHYEGFCKFVFNVYVTTINNERLTVADVNFSLVAASLHNVFKELRNPETKAVEFATQLPDDRKLHVFAKDKIFLEKLVELEGKMVEIPDSVVDTESNLRPVVLRKNLFKLGFAHNGLTSIEGYIQRLLQIRNEIAHGASNRGVPLSEYEDLRRAAFNAMDEIKRYVMNALTNRHFLRST